MAASTEDGTGWTPWHVAPNSGFVVDDPAGHVGVIQLDEKNFRVINGFRFDDADIERDLIEKLVATGRSDVDARRAVDDARTFTPRDENPTDMASIPRFMRWFENPYGLHTLAAIIHDELIGDEANGGELGSDTLSDRFFRRMMGAAGVPWLKRWIMWAAVALRSRFAAGGRRRVYLVLWLCLATTGIGSFVVASGTVVFDWSWAPDAWILFTVALVLPFASAPLWGEQYGAGFVAAIAALWILPPAAFGVIGFGIYKALEAAADRFGYE